MPEYAEAVNIHSMCIKHVFYSKLSPEEVIRIAQDFHYEHGLIGVVNTDVDCLHFDESYPYKHNYVYILGKRIWKVEVIYGLLDKIYYLLIDDESGEVLAYYDGDFMGFFENGVLFEYKIRISRKNNAFLYPCYLKKSDYDDPDNVSCLRVLDEYRQEFVEKYPFYYPDESVSRKGRKRFGGLWKFFAGIGIGYWRKGLF